MEWVTAKSDVEDALKELEEGGDRAAAIVAAALVEEHLTDALKAYLHRHPKITAELFGRSGALGSFGPKIDLAFLVGMFGASSHKELDTIRKVRDLFAHNPRLKGFGTQRVKDLINNLTKHEGRFEVKIARGQSEPYWLVYLPLETPLKTSRERYLQSCRYYTAILTTELQKRNPSLPQPFF
jgi:hypothetical protein